MNTEDTTVAAEAADRTERPRPIGGQTFVWEDGSSRWYGDDVNLSRVGEAGQTDFTYNRETGAWSGVRFNIATGERQGAVDANGIVNLSRLLAALRRMTVLTLRQANDQDRLIKQAREHEQWKQYATERAHEYANEHNFCSEFDDFMDELGLARRKRAYQVEVNIHTTLTIEVEAESDDDAGDSIDHSDVMEAAYSASRSDWDWEVENVREA